MIESLPDVRNSSTPFNKTLDAVETDAISLGQMDILQILQDGQFLARFIFIIKTFFSCVSNQLMTSLFSSLLRLKTLSDFSPVLNQLLNMVGNLAGPILILWCNTFSIIPFPFLFLLQLHHVACVM